MTVYGIPFYGEDFTDDRGLEVNTGDYLLIGSHLLGKVEDIKPSFIQMYEFGSKIGDGKVNGQSGPRYLVVHIIEIDEEYYTELWGPNWMDTGRTLGVSLASTKQSVVKVPAGSNLGAVRVLYGV